MNRIFFNAEEVSLPSWTTKAEVFVNRVLDSLNLENWELSILFCDNRYIKSLNGRYRNRDEPTDILSFPLGETAPGSGAFMAGDLVISLDALEENARFFKVPKEEELCRLLIHGILHLSGADHATNEESEPMLRTQEELLARLCKNEIMDGIL